MSCARLPLERVLFGLAGTVTLLAVFLTLTVSSWFLLFAAFAALNQWLFAATGACPVSLLLQRTPWFSTEGAP